MIRYLIAAGALGVAVLVGCGGSGSDPVACADLKGRLSLPNVTIASTTDVPDLTDWAVGHPQKVIDFGYRAHKVVSDLAKTIIAANMAAAPKFSYFYGGSNGGRETMMHAQRYPDDFDGYVSEGPAINWSR